MGYKYKKLNLIENNKGIWYSITQTFTNLW